MAQYQKQLEQTVNKQQLQFESLQETYRTNTQEYEQRISALEKELTYKQKAVEHKKQVVEPKVVEAPKVERENPFKKAPDLSPLVPITSIFAVFGAMVKMTGPTGGVR